MIVSFRNSFLRDLKKAKDRKILEQVRETIEQVEAADSPADINHLKKLGGAEVSYRIRIGDYRLGIIIEGEQVEFVRFLPRRDLYRYFP